MERVNNKYFDIILFSRWCVLTSKFLCTYEKENDYSAPTEVIEVAKVKTVKSDEKDQTVFVR